MPTSHDEKIAKLTLRYKFQQAVTALVALTSLYAVNHMDTGDYFDLHKNVPQISAQLARDHPEINPVIITADTNETVDEMEQIILIMIAALNLNAGLKMSRLGLDLKIEQYQKNTPS